MSERETKDCYNCHYLYDDGEGGEAVSSPYSYWRCQVRPTVENLRQFPFRNTKCEHFLVIEGYDEQEEIK